MLIKKIGATTTKSLVAVSILFGSTIAPTAASATAVCQPGTGCVLPIGEAPPPPPVEAPPPPPPVAEAAVVESTGGGLSLIAILAGLAALGLLAYLLLDDDEEEDVDPLPVSP